MLFSKQILICLGLFTAIAVNAQTDRVEAERPNFVVIFADDLGYSDLGCYGGEIKTPNIDCLAYNGLRFSNFMTGSKCAPSRASLLTGLYPIETGCVGPPTQMENGITIAELLKRAGYRTLMSGKWHAKENPVKRGFDHFFGVTNGAFNYFKPGLKQIYMEDEKIFSPYKPENKDQFYTTDAFTDKAVKYLDDYKNDDDPFFLYVAYNAPHWPLQAWPEDIEKYKGKYLKGWDQIRNERYERQKEMGIVPKEWSLPMRDTLVQAWEDYQNKDAADLTMATYAAMIDRLDQNVGRILAKLKETGKDKNTIVIFLSDNGACAEGHMWDGKDAKTKPGGKTSQAKLGVEWAHASNTPFRKYKRSTFNGGQLSPFIIYWPEHISDKGKIVSDKGNIADLMPTFAELAGIKYPEGEVLKVKDESSLKSEWIIQPLSGKSLLPIIRNTDRTQREHFFGYFQGARMMISDDWKIVSDGGDAAILHLYNYPWELYDLKNDGTETKDLAGEYPNRVDSLDRIYRNWIDETDHLTGIKQHEYFQPRYTKEQREVATKMESDSILKKLLEDRRSIGLSIVEILKQQHVKMKTTLGMEKTPMSYFGFVESGRKYKDSNKELASLYSDWDKNKKLSRQHCTNAGSICLEVWNIQERIRVKTSSIEVN
ncbi:arylsulfatase [Labilibaculum antarcticum]|uniref:Arylsulfatase n=1 Tax=Labilibaculum antarcticum TaxID=1717717 RepID=A0A1Y1CM80_9BACT|nr:arylsulfatase [Labilibaculum antarcticum]BAX81133.1 arylsulfatase [Labilibaculum antarcticum]